MVGDAERGMNLLVKSNGCYIAKQAEKHVFSLRRIAYDG